MCRKYDADKLVFEGVFAPHPDRKVFAELLGKRPPPHAAFFFWELFFLRLWLQKEKWISSLGVKKSVYR